MTNLISGKEALIALANGQEVLWRTKTDAEVKCFKKQTPDLEVVLSGNCDYRFWIKPRTITINGIEVPAPFEPKDFEECWVLSTRNANGYGWLNYSVDESSIKFGAWRTEEEIKQVVAALRQIFGGV
ncbi:MAG TPA: hypothetical protein GXX13_11555 [Acinetobacter towneri]|nr:hypothetical protein [Acinetobacter towneri]